MKKSSRTNSSRPCAPVNFENLLENSFSESNRSSAKTGVVPRWERKKLEKQAQSLSGSFSKNSDRFIARRSEVSDVSEVNPLTAAEMKSGTDEFTAVAGMKRDVYASSLSSALLGVDDLKNSRVLSYQDKAPTPAGDTVENLNVLYSITHAKQVQPKQNAKLVARQLPSAPTRVLDAPDLLDDYYLNLVSWSDTNWLAIVLGQTVYLWNAGSGDINELCTFDEGLEQVTSVAWVQEGGAHLAIGTNTGKTQVWDVTARKKLRAMPGHSDRVGALAWNRHMVSSGSRDGAIIHHDVRVADHITAKLETHQQEVCSLAWNTASDVLASGGNDDLLCLWDASSTQPKFSFTDHRAAVKALAWSPHEANLLASGAGTGDRTIKLWNASTGAMLNSVDTGSQVCSLVWNPFEKELLSSHGFPRNHLTLWKYPSMSKIKDFESHTNRVLYTAVGPTGEVMSAATDETLAFWDIFTPLAQPKPRAGAGLELRTMHGKKKNWTMQIR